MIKKNVDYLSKSMGRSWIKKSKGIPIMCYNILSGG
jgi:hypothetical protein